MDLTAIRAAEAELHTSATRRDRTRLRELLHAEFVEVGRSGRRWTRDEIIDALADEDERAPVLTDEWEFQMLAPDLTLATYLIHSATGDSRHCSIWTQERGRLQMRFHQGTFVLAQ